MLFSASRNEPAAASVLFVTVKVVGQLLVKLKLAGLATPFTVAVTVKVPVIAFAVKVGAVATPLALVTAIAVVEPPANVPLAPAPGAVKITFTPGNRLLFASRTVAVNAVGNGFNGNTVCPPPAVAVTEAGGIPAITRLKFLLPAGQPLLSFAVTVIAKVPACVGVPERVFPEKLSPAGKLPVSANV